MCRCGHRQRTAACAIAIGITLTVLSNLFQLGGEHQMQLQQSVNDFLSAFNSGNFHRDYLILPWYVFVLFMVAVGILIYIILQMTDLFSFYLPDEDEEQVERNRYIDVDITPPMTPENMYHQIAPSSAAAILRQKQRAQRRNINRNNNRRRGR